MDFDQMAWVIPTYHLPRYKLSKLIASKKQYSRYHRSYLHIKQEPPVINQWFSFSSLSELQTININLVHPVNVIHLC